MDAIIVSKENVLTIISSLDYGQIPVCFEDEQAEEMTSKCVEAINEIYGPGVLDFSKSDEGFETEKEVYTVFRLLFRERNLKLPLLTMDDITLMENAEHAENGQCQISFKIHEGLFKKAKRIAKTCGVKFGSTLYGQYFSGQAKKISIYKQLEKAHLDGLDKIEFTTDEIASQTLRVYVSQLNSFTGNKYSVSAENGNLTVYFKEKGRESEFLKKLERLFNEYPEVYELKSIEAFKASFKPYLVNSLMTDEKWDTITNAEDHPIREVDGLQQFYIPELEGEESNHASFTEETQKIIANNIGIYYQDFNKDTPIEDEYDF